MGQTLSERRQGAAAMGPERGNPVAALRERVVEGLLYAHSRANANTAKILEAASFLYALVEILEEKGLINVAELD